MAMLFLGSDANAWQVLWRCTASVLPIWDAAQLGAAYKGEAGFASDYRSLINSSLVDV
jgi:hypothetical protein